MVDFARKVGIVLLRCLEDDLSVCKTDGELAEVERSTNLRTVCEVVLREVDFAKGTLANELSQRIVADMP